MIFTEDKMSNRSSYIIGRRSRATGKLTTASSPSEHYSYTEALDEAQRLSALHPDSDFFVFQSVIKVGAPPAPPAVITPLHGVR